MSTEKTTNEASTPAGGNGQYSYNESQLRIIKTQICKGASDDEVAFFIATAKRLRLDPFARQIFGVMQPAGDSQVLSIRVSIDGFRLTAVRTGRYEGQVGPFYCGEDRKWTDTWISDSAPLLAKVGVIVKGAREPTFGYARYNSYVQRYEETGQPTLFWTKFPDMMLGKCSEAIALRKMFPAELSGIYAPEEMAGQGVVVAERDPNALSAEEKKLAAPLILRTEACKTNEALDELVETLKGEKLPDKVKSVIWDVMKARSASIEAWRRASS